MRIFTFQNWTCASHEGKFLDIMADEHQRYLKCLAVTDNLDAYWHYYQQCRGQEFGKECHSAAVEFFKIFDEIPGVLKGKLDSKSYAEYDKAMDLQECVESLRKLASQPDGKLDIQEDPTAFLLSTQISAFFSFLRSRLFSELGMGPVRRVEIIDRLKADKHLKWRGHLPRLKGPFDPDDLMDSAAKSPSIVIVGDIRHSQELMTYAETPIEFAGRINTFLATTRKLLDKHGAVFDKFTGDGFVAFFNEEICNRHLTNRNESFIAFLREYSDFCGNYFREWVRHLKKLPRERIGLAIGADLGIVSFENLDYHVVAVGESIVWATRMATAAKAEEILINNLLYEALRGVEGLSFDARPEETKSGEGFLAWTVSFNPAGNPHENRELI